MKIIEIVNRDFITKRFLVSLNYKNYPDRSYCISYTNDQLVSLIYDFLQENPKEYVILKNLLRDDIDD